MLKYFMMFATLLALGACNTMEGVGKDVEAAGDALEDSAEENRNY